MLSPKQSGVLECHLSHYFKNENYELCVLVGFFVTGKKDTVVCLMGARFWRLRPEKKDTVVCLAGCAICCISFWFWREIGSFFVVAGNFHYDRKKKKFQSSVWRVCQFYNIEIGDT